MWIYNTDTSITVYILEVVIQCDVHHVTSKLLRLMTLSGTDLQIIYSLETMHQILSDLNPNLTEKEVRMRT